MIRFLVTILLAAAAVTAAAHLPAIWLLAAATVLIGVIGAGRTVS